MNFFIDVIAVIFATFICWCVSFVINTTKRKHFKKAAEKHLSICPNCGEQIIFDDKFGYFIAKCPCCRIEAVFQRKK